MIARSVSNEPRGLSIHLSTTAVYYIVICGVYLFIQYAPEIPGSTLMLLMSNTSSTWELILDDGN